MQAGAYKNSKPGCFSESTMHLVNVSAFNYALYRKGGKQEAPGCWMVNESAKIESESVPAFLPLSLRPGNLASRRTRASSGLFSSKSQSQAFLV